MKGAAEFSMPKQAKDLILLVDGASRGNPGPSGIGVVIKDAKGRVLKEIGEYVGPGTNNVAEYRALLRALEEAKVMGTQAVEVRSDSDLLVSQVTGRYKVKSPDLAPLHLEASRLLRGFSRWSARHIAREENAAADALANQAIAKARPESVMEFSVLVEQRNREFVARVPALPGVEAHGTTRSAALEQVRSAVVEAVRRLRARGQPVPREERIRIRVRADSVE